MVSTFTHWAIHEATLTLIKDLCSFKIDTDELKQTLLWLYWPGNFQYPFLIHLLKSKNIVRPLRSVCWLFDGSSDLNCTSTFTTINKQNVEAFVLDKTENLKVICTVSVCISFLSLTALSFKSNSSVCIHKVKTEKKKTYTSSFLPEPSCCLFLLSWGLFLYESLVFFENELPSWPIIIF